MNKIMSKYNDARQSLYDHVGFVEDWVVCPIDDQTDMFWILNDDGVTYAETKEQLESDGNYYQDDIYTQRFYNKHVYEGKDLTMIFCNPHVDGMQWFRIFENSKRVI